VVHVPKPRPLGVRNRFKSGDEPAFQFGVLNPDDKPLGVVSGTQVPQRVAAFFVGVGVLDEDEVRRLLLPIRGNRSRPVGFVLTSEASGGHCRV